MDNILRAFKRGDYSLSDFLSQLLNVPTYHDQPITQSASENIEELLNILISSQCTALGTRRWALSYAQSVYTSQMGSLCHKAGGFHFNAKKVTEERIKNFSITDIAQNLESDAPELSELIRLLLCADKRAFSRKAASRQKESRLGQKRKRSTHDGDGGEVEVELGGVDVQDSLEDITEMNEEAEAEDNVQLLDDEDDEPEDFQDQKHEQQQALITIVSRKHSYQLSINTYRFLEAGFVH